MFFARIVVIFSAVRDGSDAAFTARRALRQAARPELLCFAVPQEYFAGFQTFAGAEVSAERMKAYQEENGLSGIADLFANETHFLLLMGKYDFAAGWDKALQAALQRLPIEKALLSGSMRAPMGGEATPLPLHKRRRTETKPKAPPDAPTLVFSPVRVLKNNQPVGRSGQACLPCLTGPVQEDGIGIGCGLPLVCAAEPVRTLVADPAFTFGPAAFLREAEKEKLSFSAYAAGYAVYVPTEAWLWPVGRLPKRRLCRTAQVLPGTTAARFEQLTGVEKGVEQISAKAAMGLFGVANTYPQRLPPSLRMKQRLRGLHMSLRETHLPLLVSAFIDLPGPRGLPAAYCLRFGFLKDVKSLPLLLYTGGSQERQLRPALPNTQSYPDRAVWSRLPGVPSENDRFRRSKLLLMLRAAQRQPEFGHVAWVDMDILPHPICSEAVPDFQPMMDEAVHMAVVDGVPDLSFVIMPVSILKRMEREAASITQLDVEMKRDLSEKALWARLYQKWPQDFVLHPMPARQLLFLSAFDPELLSAEVAASLQSTAPADSPKMSRRKHEDGK